jgi:guanylate kinase
VVSGPRPGSQGAGEVRGLRDRRHLYFSVSATTRSPRPGEVDGVHYWFVSWGEFERLIANGELLEWAEFSGRRYGTPLQPVVEHLTAGDDVILEIEVQGARQVRSKYPAAIMFFILPPRMEALAERLAERGDTSEAEIRRRMAIAEEEVEEAPTLFDHLVVNDDLARCIDEVDRLMDVADMSGRPLPPG